MKEMKNKERYAKEIIEIACSGGSIAVTKECMRIEPCGSTFCNKCLFCANNCKEKVREWAESEYIEQAKISKRDMAFLDYLREEYKFVARNEDGKLFAYSSKPYKDKNFKCWCVYDCINNRLILNYNVDFPMIKWEDSEPWKIEDLKKLQVVEEYEKCLN